MDYLTRAIKSLKPTAQFSFNNDDYSTIKWDVLDGDAPTKKQIDDEIKRLKASEITQAAAIATQRQEILDRLGLTAEEARLLLG